MKSKHPPENHSTRTSRRRFAKAVVAAVTVGVVSSAQSSRTGAQTRPAPKQSPAPPNPQPTPAAAPPPSPLAEAYTEVARARFGGKVSPEEFSGIKSDIEGNLRTAERLRAFKLQNADEPDFVFDA